MMRSSIGIFDVADGSSSKASMSSFLVLRSFRNANQLSLFGVVLCAQACFGFARDLANGAGCHLLLGIPKVDLINYVLPPVLVDGA